MYLERAHPAFLTTLVVHVDFEKRFLIHSIPENTVSIFLKGEWWIGKKLGSKINFLYLKNETKTEEIPLHGWKVSQEAFQMKNKEWSDDATIKIKKGSLASVSERIKFNRKDRIDDD